MMKYFTNLLGYLVLFLSLLFLIHKIYIFKSDIKYFLTKKEILFFIVWAACFYTIILTLLVFSWGTFLQIFEKKNFAIIYFIYARSQIAKYLPGNIFHYAGRQTIGYTFGLKHLPIFMATLLESILLIMAAILIAICGIPLLKFIKESWKLLFILESISLVSFVLLIFFLPKILNYFSSLQKIFGKFIVLDAKSWFKLISFPLLLYILTFILIGVLLWIIAIFCFKIETSWRTFLAFPTVFAMAWVLGFITPGAPGGIGVREAILIVGLSPFIGKSVASNISILSRIITILGDFFFYLSSYVVPSFLNRRGRGSPRCRSPSPDAFLARAKKGETCSTEHDLPR